MSQDDRLIIGGVRIVTTEGLIFQGQLVPPTTPLLPVIPGLANQFIFLLLNCPPEILYNGTREDIQPPLFDDGDIVQINVSHIIAVGPSGDCLVDGPCKA